ncbi:MAG: hypothetical protein PVG99_15870, partial [Desulfobacteraceae bacterium]
MKLRLREFWKPTAGNKQPLYLELISFLLVFGLGILWWWAEIFRVVWQPDGNNYQLAADLVRQGRSPYEHPLYPYPPTIAVIGAWITGLWGSEAFRLIFRIANLLGGCAALWGSWLLSRWPWLLRLGAAGLGIFLAPTLANGIISDNVSTLASGTAIVGLVLWQRIPLVAGIMLGFSLALKPIAIIGFVLLALHRPSLPQRKQWFASGIAVITLAILLSIAPQWLLSGLSDPNVKATASDWARDYINVSLCRVLAFFGIKLSPYVPMAIILFIGILYVRRRSLNEIQILCVACTASLLALPIVWRHTLLLALPIQCMALVMAVQRLRQGWKGSQKIEVSESRLRGLSQLLLVIAGCITIFEADLYSVLVPEWPYWLHGVTLLIPIAVLILLTGYVVRAEDASASE